MSDDLHATTAEERAELLRLAGEATPLPWADMVGTDFDGEIRGCETFTLVFSDPDGDDRPHDRAYAVDAVNRATALARQVNALEAEIERLRERLAGYEAPCHDVRQFYKEDTT